MAAKLTGLTWMTAVLWHLVAESCNTCLSWPQHKSGSFRTLLHCLYCNWCPTDMYDTQTGFPQHQALMHSQILNSVFIQSNTGCSYITFCSWIAEPYYWPQNGEMSKREQLYCMEWVVQHVIGKVDRCFHHHWYHFLLHHWHFHHLHLYYLMVLNQLLCHLQPILAITFQNRWDGDT